MLFRLIFLFGLLLQCSTLFANESVKRVGYSQIIAHPALSAIYEGMTSELEKQGFEIGKDIEIDYQVAQGDMAINSQIAQKFVGNNLDVIVASTTPSAQAVIAAAHGRTPIIFTGVSDPLSAKLVTNLEKPGGNVTGVMESIAYDSMLETIQTALPNAKNIGTIYNPGEDNSNSTNKILTEKIEAQGLNFYKAPARNTGEVLEAAQSLVNKIDVLIITLDNTVVTALPSVIQVADQYKIPVFTFDTFSVEKGAAIGVGYDEYDVGKLTAQKLIAILNGEDVGDIPVSTVKKIRTVINPSAADRQGLTIPDAIKNNASQIIQEF